MNKLEECKKLIKERTDLMKLINDLRARNRKYSSEGIKIPKEENLFILKRKLKDLNWNLLMNFEKEIELISEHDAKNEEDGK